MRARLHEPEAQRKQAQHLQQRGEPNPIQNLPQRQAACQALPLQLHPTSALLGGNAAPLLHHLRAPALPQGAPRRAQGFGVVAGTHARAHAC